MNNEHTSQAQVTFSNEQMSFDDFVEMVRRFHNYPAPGVLLGGFMVEATRSLLPPDTLFEAVSETSWCLPDSIQLLTPCTIGNGWIKVVDMGIYGMSLYDKYTGEGFRTALDPAKLEHWPAIHEWLFRTRPKKEQDSVKLQQEIRDAGASICTITPMRVKPELLRKRSKGQVIICPLCGEAFPDKHGGICRLCQGQGPYADFTPSMGSGAAPAHLSSPVGVPVEDSVGKAVLHDMTQIIPGESKDVAFTRGHVVTPGDVCRLQRMGRMNVYIECEDGSETGPVHEDEAAKVFAELLSGPGVKPLGPPKEGKINLVADRDGMLVYDEDRLEAFNLLPDVVAAARTLYTLSGKGRPVAATRAIPLYLERRHFERAASFLSQDGPLFEVKPLRQAKVGILITGNEVFHGLIEDKFESTVTAKVTGLGSSVQGVVVTPDDRQIIADAVESLAGKGCDLIVTTAGLSVDPDDVTRQGLMDAGVTDMLYGMPVLPGAMTLIARKGNIQILGVPACALFHKTTALDLVLPRLLADVPITRRDLSKLAPGGLCRECSVCSFPKCDFGR